MNIEFPQQIFEKNIQYKIGADCFHTDGQTDMTNIIVSFRSLKLAENRGVHCIL
jgi:hypothetical protein